MTREWKNQRNDRSGGTTSTTLRMRNGVRDRVGKLAARHHTTITAIVDYALEKFLEENDPKYVAPPAAPTGPAGLFDD